MKKKGMIITFQVHCKMANGGGVYLESLERFWSGLCNQWLLFRQALESEVVNVKYTI